MSPLAQSPVIVDPNEGLNWLNLREHLLRKLLLPENAHTLAGRSPEDIAARMSVNVLKAFVGFPQPETLGGVTLLRGTSFRDPYEKRNDPFGGWWFPEAFLLGLRDPIGGGSLLQLSGQDGLRQKLQSLLALSDNFSDIEQLWCIRLKAGAKLTGLAGPASPQPVDSSLAGSYLNMGNLPGGGWQYYFPNIPVDAVEPYPLRLLEGAWFGKRVLR